MAKIVIVDSGVNLEHKKLKDVTLSGIHIWKDEEGKLVRDDDINDVYGHGTAVTNIIHKTAPENEIFEIKMFHNAYEADEELLLEALKIIYEEIPCDIVNLSLGITEYDSLSELKDICTKIHDRGTVIVCAFDNLGKVSFPAAFDNVIGVDTSFLAKKNTEYEYVENSYVNILAKGGLQRVAWTSPEYIVTKGNSFATPYITCVIAKALDNGVKPFEIMNYLKDNAKNIVDYSPYDDKKKPEKFMPKKAVVFPFNKEMHSIVRFDKRLKFSLQVCDVRESGLVGSNTSYKVPGTDYQIQNIYQLNWEDDFDTLILGHNEELSILTNSDLTGYVLDKCIEYHKNVFAFDALIKYEEQVEKLLDMGCKVYYPQVDINDVPRNSFDKLYFISKPILMVCGTSSAQGKFTLQTKLRDRFENDNLKVAQIGTEPSSLLYGYDDVCPIGYGSNIQVKDYRFISAVNKMFFEASNKECDIIISGTQSGTIPYSFDSLRNIPLYSMEYMLGARPDGVVLCVNAHDEVDYLKRTIGVIENLYDTKIIALSLFPLTFENNWAGNTGLKRMITEKEKEDFINNATKVLGKSIFVMDEEEQYDRLYECVLNYFLATEDEEVA